MSDETKPFAAHEKNDWLNIPEADIDARSGYFEIQVEGADVMACNINAAVAARERKAAAKALREAAKKWPKARGKIDPGDVGLWLAAEAAAVEKGGAR